MLHYLPTRLSYRCFREPLTRSHPIFSAFLPFSPDRRLLRIFERMTIRSQQTPIRSHSFSNLSKICTYVYGINYTCIIRVSVLFCIPIAPLFLLSSLHSFSFLTPLSLPACQSYRCGILKDNQIGHDCCTMYRSCFAKTLERQRVMLCPELCPIIPPIVRSVRIIVLHTRYRRSQRIYESRT